MHENVKISVKVNAPLDKVWNAITNKEQMKNWYFDVPDFEPKIGNNFSFYGGDENEEYHHFCEIVDLIPNEKLKHSWTYPEISKEKTLVKWELKPENEGTIVTLTHKGLEAFEHLGENFKIHSFRKGWEDIVGKSLKEFVEN
jgi:uncharacterized protein YndB with AHSA1/START domain